jgi:hypothetical protein
MDADMIRYIKMGKDTDTDKDVDTNMDVDSDK